MLGLIGLAEDLANKKSNDTIYIQNGTKLVIKEITGLENGNLLITTCSVFEKFSIFGDSWFEITFNLEYDIHDDEALELLKDYGYYDYQNLSVLDFMKIKSKGRKLYKFTVSKAVKIKETIRRQLDLNNYDDVNKIYKIYYGKVSKYRNMVHDIKDFTFYVEDEKDAYIRDVNKLEEYHKLCTKLLDEMSSDE